MEEGKKRHVRLSRVAGIIAMLALLISPLVAAYAAPQDDKQPASSSSAGITVEPEIAAKMNAEGSAGYMIYFRAKPKLAQANSMSRKTQGEFVVNSLQKSAESAQAGVRKYLDKNKVQYKSFWIDNIIVVEKSDKAVFDGLMQFSEIASIKARRTMMLHEPVERRASPAQTTMCPWRLSPTSPM